jgi:molecular chaperone Hsp33
MADLRAASHADDIVLPFRIEGTSLSGRLIRLGAAVDRVLRAHNYPLPVSMLLGETVALAGLIGSALKFDGTLTLQAQGDGPVSMLLANHRSPGQLRGYASFTQNHVALAKAIPSDLGLLLGSGHFALTIDPTDTKKRYQGIVPLEKNGLSACAIGYFTRSEQVPTLLRTAVGPHYQLQRKDKQWRSGGIMIQRMAREGGKNTAARDEDNDWRRISRLLDTVEDHELLDPMLSPEQLLLRLFHDDRVRVFSPQSLEFACSCSRERIKSVLLRFNRDSLREMLVNGTISARCEFCNRGYDFLLDELMNSD